MTGLAIPGAPPGVPEIRFHLPAERLRPLVTSYYFLESAGPLCDRRARRCSVPPTAPGAS